MADEITDEQIEEIERDARNEGLETAALECEKILDAAAIVRSKLNPGTEFAFENGKIDALVDARNAIRALKSN